MEQRKLGPSDLDVPSICLGGNVYGWTLSEADTFHQLDHALDVGLNFIDTADVYSRWAPGHQGGESESILGRWFAKSGRRKEVILATKVGMEMGDGKKGLAPAVSPMRSRPRSSACKRTASTSTRPTATTPKRRSRKPSARSMRL